MNEQIVDLGEALTLDQLQDLRRVITPLWQQQQSIRLEAGSLRMIDCAGLQFIFCLQQSLAAAGRPLRWGAPSEIIDRAAAQAGLALTTAVDDAAEAEQGFGFF